MRVEIVNRTGRQLACVSVRRGRRISAMILDPNDIDTVDQAGFRVIEGDRRGDGAGSQSELSTKRHSELD